MIEDWRSKPAPTHRCKICGALWRFWQKEECEAARDDSWSLCSTACGECCDMALMGSQIEYLTQGELEKFIAAQQAVEAMEKHLNGPGH